MNSRTELLVSTRWQATETHGTCIVIVSNGRHQQCGRLSSSATVQVSAMHGTCAARVAWYTKKPLGVPTCTHDRLMVV